VSVGGALSMAWRLVEAAACPATLDWGDCSAVYGGTVQLSAGGEFSGLQL